ncbi:MAG: deoxyribodipyrimidine photo-lyase [Legionella sp.]|jgi:deoxyribodipyrimidine photo-lyase|nr:deoxyribodipyrimidine photo-lyase [Legionella sp.]
MKLMWFRRDLRIEDNPALYQASLAQQGVIALHITTPTTWQRHHMSAVQQDWLNQNLDALQQALDTINIPLIRTQTDFFSNCHEVILDLIKHYKITEVYFNLEYEWDERARDHQIIKKLKAANIPVYIFHDQCIIPPDQLFNQQAQPYMVFTPYKKASLAYMQSNPSMLMTANTPLSQKTTSITSSNHCTHTPSHTQDISWIKPGNRAGLTKVQQFIEHKIQDYAEARDIPSIDGTSCISPYLALGIISVRQCIQLLIDSTPHHSLSQISENNGAMTWLSELIWRDFYKMICFNFPQISRNQPFKAKTNSLEWSKNQAHLLAWQQGQTGVPIVDAAMRQLNQYGWMHNRLRMVSAMYLTKNLWIDWREGETYFASKLVDWDFASNNGGWQWSASTGTDAVPYFRVFNPVSQSERFDPQGQFIQQYCPELKSLDHKQIHDPYHQCKKQLDYPKPLVDLKSSRAYAIEKFKMI